MIVIKRDGRREEFDADKVFKSLKKAFIACDYSILDSKVNELVSELQFWDEISIEEIQDQIEEVLMDYGYNDVAKQFILYRYQHALQREANMLTQATNLFNGTDSFLMTENANKKAELTNVQFSYLGGLLGKFYCQKVIFPKWLLKSHDKGAIHIHDMDMSAMSGITNCCLINLKACLYEEDENGICTVMNDVGIKKQTHFVTACTVASQLVMATAASQYGGATITLTHLVPALITETNILKKEHPATWKSDYKRLIRDGVQTLMYQVNSMYTTQGQTPFLTVFAYLNEIEESKRQYLADIIEEVLKQRIQGMQDKYGNWVAPAFPKLIYVLQEDNIHKDDKWWYLTELAAKCNVNRCAPDYISEKIMNQIHGYTYSSMGCRSFLSPWYNDKGEMQVYGRLNCGVVTLNLPYIAAEAMNKHISFYDILDKYAEQCHTAHLIRLKRIWNTSINCAPVLWKYGIFTKCKDDNAKIGDIIKGGYASVSLGYAGLYECIRILGYKNHWEDGKEEAINILKKLNEYCKQWSTEDNMAYGVYGTPLESTTTKFAKALKSIYPQYDRLYVTNSYHIPVFEPIDPFRKLEIEGEFQKYSKNGCISYIECADMHNNIEAIEEVQKCIYNHCMYAELNIKSCKCYTCGSEEPQQIDDNLVWYCPKCRETDPTKLRHLYRICGYASVENANEGRTSDVKDRYIHLDNHEIQ